MQSENLTVPKYQLMDVVESYANVRGTIINMEWNEYLKEWFYYTIDTPMIVKESNIKNGKQTTKV